jgi:hypothetical protein
VGITDKGPAGNNWNDYQPNNDQYVSHIPGFTGSPYTYFHHTPDINYPSVVPVPFTPFITTVQSAFTKTSTSCEPIPLTVNQIVELVDSLDLILDSLQSLRDSLFTGLDQSNTTNLLNYISDSTITSAMLSDSLITYSPLSDGVIEDYFNRSWPVLESNLFDVMIYNLPVSSQIYESFINRLATFTDSTLADSLFNLYANNPYHQTITSLDRELDAVVVDRNEWFGQIIDHLIETDSIPQLIFLLENQNEKSYRMDAFGSALLTGNLSLAHELFSSIELISPSELYWGQLSEIALTLSDSGLTWFSMDSTMIETVLAIALVENECTAKRNAQSILRLIRGMDFVEPPFYGDSIGSRISGEAIYSPAHQADDRTEKSSTSEFKVYPNPANEKLFIESNSFGEVTKIRVSDIAGRILISNKIADKKLELDIRELGSGVYFLIIDSDSNQYRSKFIVHR